jgi:hypothetical protein
MSLGSQRLGCLMQGSDKKAFECQNFMPDTYDLVNGIFGFAGRSGMEYFAKQ